MIDTEALCFRNNYSKVKKKKILIFCKSQNQKIVSNNSNIISELNRCLFLKCFFKGKNKNLSI